MRNSTSNRRKSAQIVALKPEEQNGVRSGKTCDVFIQSDWFLKYLLRFNNQHEVVVYAKCSEKPLQTISFCIALLSAQSNGQSKYELAQFGALHLIIR